MIERAQAVAAAEEWLAAWNAHDPERVVAHFSDDVVIHSPLADQIRPGSNGVLRGKEAVLSYYRDGLAASRGLKFSLLDVCVGVDGITIVYRNHRGILVTESLTFGADGRATEVRVGYGA